MILVIRIKRVSLPELGSCVTPPMTFPHITQVLHQKVILNSLYLVIMVT